MHVRSRNLNFFDNFRRYFDNFRRYIYFPKSLSDRILRFRGIPWICCSPHLSEWDFRFRGPTCILQKNIFSGNNDKRGVRIPVNGLQFGFLRNNSRFTLDIAPIPGLVCKTVRGRVKVREAHFSTCVKRTFLALSLFLECMWGPGIWQKIEISRHCRNLLFASFIWLKFQISGAHMHSRKKIVEIWQNGSNDSCKQTSSSEF